MALRPKGTLDICVQQIKRPTPVRALAPAGADEADERSSRYPTSLVIGPARSNAIGSTATLIQECI